MEGPLIEYGLMTKVKMAGYSPIFVCVCFYRTREGSAVASWLVSSTPDRAVRVQALIGNIELCS